MTLSKNAQYTSNLSCDESAGRGHRKRKQKRFSDSEADGKDVQLQHAQRVLVRNHPGRCFFAVKCR